MDTTQIDRMIRTLLSGGAVDWSAVAGSDGRETFLRRVDFHGVVGCLTETDAGMPAGIAEALAARRMHAFFWEDEHRAMVVGLLGALSAAGIAHLLIKGTALAYTVYKTPAARLRADTDLVVREEDRARALDVLAGAGFEADLVADEAVTVRELTFSRRGRIGTHSIDLHWGLMNSVYLSRSFDVDTLLARARPAPRLSPEARVPCPVDALTIACVHRQVHLVAPYYVGGTAHYDADRLIWMLDIDRIARGLSVKEEADLATRAAAQGIAGSCHDGLKRAGALLGTSMPAALARAAGRAPDEGATRFLTAGGMRRQWMNFRAQKGTAARFGHLRALLLPPAPYMRARYPGADRWPLAALYARRAIGGALRPITGRVWSRLRPRPGSDPDVGAER